MPNVCIFRGMIQGILLKSLVKLMATQFHPQSLAVQERGYALAIQEKKDQARVMYQAKDQVVFPFLPLVIRSIFL